MPNTGIYRDRRQIHVVMTRYGEGWRVGAKKGAEFFAGDKMALNLVMIAIPVNAHLSPFELWYVSYISSQSVNMK